MSSVYNRAKYLTIQPPLAHGGHTLNCLDPIGDYDGPPLLQCISCHMIVADWQLREGFTLRCRGLLAELPTKSQPRRRRWRRS